MIVGGAGAAARIPHARAVAPAQTVQVARVPELADLPRLQSNLRNALKPLDDAEFATFVKRAFYEAGSNSPELASVAWPRVLDELRSLAEERALPDQTIAKLDLQHAYYIAAVRRDPAGGLLVLDTALARYRIHDETRAQLALFAENIAREEEIWLEARQYLAQAEESLAGVPAKSDVIARFHGGSADLWLALGLPELARPHVEFELERARDTGDPATCVRAFADELKLLVVEENYAAVEARLDVCSEAWFASLAPDAQARCLLHVAAGLMSAEHDEVAPRGRGASLLDELLRANTLDAGYRSWAMLHRAVVAADSGDWALAHQLCDCLRLELNTVGVPEDYLPPGRLGEALVGLEARIELAQSHGAPDRESTLRKHLARVRRSWQEFLSHWSGAPVRGGGLAYLHIAERHQLLQELVELELAVHGEEHGASRALQDVLDAEQESTFARRMRFPPIGVEEIRRELTDPYSGLLVYVPSRDRSFVFALDSRGVRLFHLGAEYRVRGPCRALAAAAQSAVHSGSGIDDPALVAAAADCARAMLPSAIEDHIAAWRKIVIVGIDDFGYVPFELFPARDGLTQGTMRAVSYCPTVAMAVALRRAPGPPAGRARLLLAPEISDPANALTLSDAEVRALEDSFSGATEILAGPAAVAERLGVIAGENVSLLYLLTHGTHDAACERPGRLLMAQSSSSNGVVSADDIEKMHSAPLVVLTACKVGSAPMRRGDGGRSDLAAAFLYSGASSVVLPTCDLELGATLRTVPRILRSLSSGRATADALRAARSELIAERDPVAALQAHLLHVVGCGDTRLPVVEATRDASTFSRARWWVALGALGLAAWVARSRSKERASRAGIPHGSRSH